MHGRTAFDVFTALLKWGNGTRKDSCWQSCAVPHSEMTVGQANRTEGGWGLPARKSMVALFISSPFPPLHL